MGLIMSSIVLTLILYAIQAVTLLDCVGTENDY